MTEAPALSRSLAELLADSRVVELAKAAPGVALHLVGGAVRDAGLGRPVHDLDVVVAGSAAGDRRPSRCRDRRSPGRAGRRTVRSAPPGRGKRPHRPLGPPGRARCFPTSGGGTSPSTPSRSRCRTARSSIPPAAWTISPGVGCARRAPGSSPKTRSGFCDWPGSRRSSPASQPIPRPSPGTSRHAAPARNAARAPARRARDPLRPTATRAGSGLVRRSSTCRRSFSVKGQSCRAQSAETLPTAERLDEWRAARSAEPLHPSPKSISDPNSPWRCTGLYSPSFFLRRARQPRRGCATWRGEA